MLIYVIVIIVGVLAGGAVNWLADDLPHYRLPSRPRYPDGSPRPLVAWLGLTAFIFGRRSTPGGATLSWRYPLVELATAGLMLLTLLVKLNSPDSSPLQLVFWLAYMPILVLITVIDLEHRLILFAVIIPTAVLAILDAVLTPVQREPNLERALLGGALGFGVFFLMYLGGIAYVYIAGQMRGQPISEIAFGYGDVMLAAVSGLILGLESAIFAMFITVFLGAGGALLYIIVRGLAGKRYSAFTALPYGPYLVIGTLVMLLFSSQVRMVLVGY